MCMQTSANKLELQLGWLPATAGRLSGVEGGRSGLGRALRPWSPPTPHCRPQALTVAACLQVGWEDEKMWHLEAGVPETECLVNTDVSLDSHQVLLPLPCFRSGLSRFANESLQEFQGQALPCISILYFLNLRGSLFFSLWELKPPAKGFFGPELGLRKFSLHPFLPPPSPMLLPSGFQTFFSCPVLAPAAQPLRNFLLQAFTPSSVTNFSLPSPMAFTYPALRP